MAPSNSETWPESVKNAEKETSLIMTRMADPNLAKVKPEKKKIELKVNLVRGHSGLLEVHPGTNTSGGINLA